MPPNIHVFIWLIFHNKSLTRHNFAKHRSMADPTCVFCNVFESIKHLFFDCIVGERTWAIVYGILNIHVPCSFISLYHIWKQINQFDAINLVTSATCGAYGCFEMILSSRVENGEACALR